jgi:hypothetical protein
MSERYERELGFLLRRAIVEVTDLGRPLTARDVAQGAIRALEDYAGITAALTDEDWAMVEKVAESMLQAEAKERVAAGLGALRDLRRLERGD